LILLKHSRKNVKLLANISNPSINDTVDAVSKGFSYQFNKKAIYENM